MAATDPLPKVTGALLARYDRPGPRYTSYPTAVEFHEGFGEEDYRHALAAADELGDAPLSVYTHIPFCERRCTFCGCHTVATAKREVAEPYLTHLLKEMQIVAALLPRRRRVAQAHLGGGTPTYLSTEQLGRLIDGFTSHFELQPGAEVAIEVDPRVTTAEQLDLLAGRGFNRLSIGVQDFTEEVQRAAGRVQGVEQTLALIDHARSAGFSGINIDLIYGLPFQRPETFDETLRIVVGARPDRVAVYSFAYVPWLKGHQKRLPQQALPGREEKLALLALARERFVGAGYHAIGMDHFALADDELAVAQRQGRLFRNFMGYTVMPGDDALGFGISAIGDVRGAFAQNHKKLSTYYAALDAGRLPIQKGYVRNADDEVRRAVITGLMCNGRIDRTLIERRFGIDFATTFAVELDRLRPHVQEGMCVVDDDGVRATEIGQLFVRNLAMCFDAYLAAKQKQGRPMFSRTV